MNRFFCILSLVFLIVISCSHERKNDLGKVKHRYQKKEHKEEIIVDCNYTYDEAIENSKAPDSVLSELKLINVRYYSVDGKIHAGQILTNERAVEKIQQLFEILLDEKFPVAHAVPVEVRLYDRLFATETPENVEEGHDFKENLNPDSLKVITAFAESSVKKAKAGDRFQFERLGYFCVDPDTTDSKIVFNRTVALKDNWTKSAQQ